MEYPVGNVPDGPADPDGGIVPEVPPDLPGDHGHPVGGKTHLLVRVKIGNCLDQADASHLEKVVRTFAPFVKALDDGQHQTEISFNQCFPGPFIPQFGPPEQKIHFGLWNGPEPGCVHAADFYFSLHGVPPVIGFAGSIPHTGKKDTCRALLWNIHKFSGSKRLRKGF